MKTLVGKPWKFKIIEIYGESIPKGSAIKERLMSLFLSYSSKEVQSLLVAPFASANMIMEPKRMIDPDFLRCSQLVTEEITIKDYRVPHSYIMPLISNAYNCRVLKFEHWKFGSQKGVEESDLVGIPWTKKKLQTFLLENWIVDSYLTIKIGVEETDWFRALSKSIGDSKDNIPPKVIVRYTREFEDSLQEE